MKNIGIVKSLFIGLTVILKVRFADLLFRKKTISKLLLIAAGLIIWILFEYVGKTFIGRDRGERDCQYILSELPPWGIWRDIYELSFDPFRGYMINLDA